MREAGARWTQGSLSPSLREKVRVRGSIRTRLASGSDAANDECGVITQNLPHPNPLPRGEKVPRGASCEDTRDDLRRGLLGGGPEVEALGQVAAGRPFGDRYAIDVRGWRASLAACQHLGDGRI